ncbi:MAG: hypothetical protein BA864_06880 [Desulfuromonadales bacterium C00003093]|nr:MAG: hypothetical protein BA864_06880 [Desulfuromonadales bacterium C00003093]
MGRRTDAMREFIRFLRTTEPKYSFEIFIFHITLGFATGVFVILGKTGFWLLSSGVLWLSLGIHWFRLRRVIKRQIRQIRQEQAWAERMLPRIEQALANYERAMDATRKHKTVDPAELEHLREDVERARQREAAGEP